MAKLQSGRGAVSPTAGDWSSLSCGYERADDGVVVIVTLLWSSYRHEARGLCFAGKLLVGLFVG